MGKKETKEQILLPYLVEGTRYLDIQAKTGISKSTISRIANQQHIKEIIERSHTELIETTAGDVIYNQRQKIKLAKSILDNGDYSCDGVSKDKMLTLADKCEERIGQAMGIFPGAASVMINHVHNDNRSVTISPQVQSALGDAINSILGNISDAEYSEI